MNRNVVIVALVVAAVAIAGAGYWLLRDDDGTGPAASAAREGRKARPGDDGFRDPPAGDALSPEQQQRLRGALEKLAAEGNRRAALSGGVNEPWPLDVAQQEYEACLVRVKGTLAGGSTVTDEQACACATRAVQQVFPAERPKPGTRNMIRAYERTYREAVASCAGLDN